MGGNGEKRRPGCQRLKNLDLSEMRVADILHYLGARPLILGLFTKSSPKGRFLRLLALIAPPKIGRQRNHQFRTDNAKNALLGLFIQEKKKQREEDEERSKAPPRLSQFIGTAGHPFSGDDRGRGGGRRGRHPRRPPRGSCPPNSATSEKDLHNLTRPRAARASTRPVAGVRSDPPVASMPPRASPGTDQVRR